MVRSDGTKRRSGETVRKDGTERRCGETMLRDNKERRNGETHKVSLLLHSKMTCRPKDFNQQRKIGVTPNAG